MLTQDEANYLLELLKKLVNEGTLNFPGAGSHKSLDLLSHDGKEKFIVDINRKSQIKITKCTFQERYRNYIILLRLDLDGPGHTNPNGEVIHSPHLHIYQEGYGDAWAYPLPENLFPDPTNLIETLANFLQYCKVTNLDRIKIQGGLLP